ncbi:MAG: ribosomal-protein-alanine N-acetyltransferase [Calditrichales bacterium]|nr:MAG: ribosomal-protein-alanine N-acetyltransferase [Calditrichales bacterium]
MNLLFRKMLPPDVPNVGQMEQDLFSDPWPQTSFMAEVHREKISFPFVVEESGEIIGYIVCWYYYNELHIGNIAVRRDKQGNGIGKYILNKIFAYFKDFDKAFLEVRESNKTAIALYNKYGFEVVHTRVAYYSDGENALVMAKSAN